MALKTKKACAFCTESAMHIDYKNIPVIGRFVDYYGRMKKRYYQGTCLSHQKKLATAIKNARIMGLLPFVR